MKKSLILLALAAGFTFTSCDKEDEAPSKTQLLTGKNWKVTAATVSVNSGNPNNTYALLKECEKDNFESYATDGKLTIDEGATKCTANEPQTQAGTWQFTENESKLKTTRGTNIAEHTITELSASKMVLTLDQSFDNNGTTTTYRFVTTFEVK